MISQPMAEPESSDHSIILRQPERGEWLLFDQPHEIIRADSLEQVLPALQRIEALVEEQGWHAAGFIAYEAAPAFDPALRVCPAPEFPLLWFGIYPPPVNAPNLPEFNFAVGRIGDPPIWKPSIEREAYGRAIERIKEHIAAGDTYQVNFTLRLRSPFNGEAKALFYTLTQPQPAPYSAWIDAGRYAICSVSPELFFHRDGPALTGRPMKGTARRGRYTDEDRSLADWLYHSEKNRAENVMIVDMTRNDLGKIAETGSVSVPKLFEIERYPTVWQMTSTVTAASQASFVEVISALFPCASITGAPKPRTMGIIAELEGEPRRLYTGCIGYLAPGQKAQFNVAIRTVIVDRATGQAEYGVGGGIVWDSQADEEYAECQDKARALTERKEEFSLLETLRWSPGEGYYLLEGHLQRLGDSAEFFGFSLDPRRVIAELEKLAGELPPHTHRVRLLARRDGAVSLEAASIEMSDQPLRLALAPKSVDSSDKFLFHKTTRRRVYDELLAAYPNFDDVILWNERGELTETCLGNLVLKLDGRFVTPPVECGLLAGVLRAWSLENMDINEGVLSVEMLKECEAVYRINSVRGWQVGEVVT